jgi:hypothetical protein
MTVDRWTTNAPTVERSISENRQAAYDIALEHAAAVVSVCTA